MNIKVVKIGNLPSQFMGGKSICNIEIEVDKRLSKRDQREIVIHEVTENFFPSMGHNKIDWFTDLMLGALDEV